MSILTKIMNAKVFVSLTCFHIKAEQWTDIIVGEWYMQILIPESRGGKLVKYITNGTYDATSCSDAPHQACMRVTLVLPNHNKTNLTNHCPRYTEEIPPELSGAGGPATRCGESKPVFSMAGNALNTEAIVFAPSRCWFFLLRNGMWLQGALCPDHRRNSPENSMKLNSNYSLNVR